MVLCLPTAAACAVLVGILWVDAGERVASIANSIDLLIFPLQGLARFPASVLLGIALVFPLLLANRLARERLDPLLAGYLGGALLFVLWVVAAGVCVKLQWLPFPITFTCRTWGYRMITRPAGRGALTPLAEHMECHNPSGGQFR
jgi:hypothetical protein